LGTQRDGFGTQRDGLGTQQDGPSLNFTTVAKYILSGLQNFPPQLIPCHCPK
jgi:hypothetical protein